jgi:hypothetical protein
LVTSLTTLALNLKEIIVKEVGARKFAYYLVNSASNDRKSRYRRSKEQHCYQRLVATS